MISLCTSLYAQISFSDQSYLLSNKDHYSGVAMGVTDMNGDGLDDIVRLNGARFMSIDFQTQPGQKFSTQESINTTSSTNQWSLCIGDTDNNGTNEVLVGGSYNEVTLIEMINGGDAFDVSVLPESFDVFVQGSNFVDINNDGFLDIFVCHDDEESRIWRNNGDGTYSTQDDWIDMSVNGDSGEGASGNYGSIWVDIDNDGDQDLYIAKCRQGVSDVTDKRRINQLYINDGNGNFTEEADDRGLAVGWQSWSADFQDINNDGWMDCFITNHDQASQLFLNDGNGYFSELPLSGINVDGIPIQGLLRDFDNDGWVDVITTGSRGQVFRNNGDLTFSEISNLFDEEGMESLAVGDLNNDGYLDLYGGYAILFNRPSQISDKLWINKGDTNKYLAVSLVGTESNRNAIGARIEIYGDWGMQVREVRSGESYGITNSMTSYFGLGDSESIDSMHIRWPSGHIQTEYNLKTNSKIKIVEGECWAPVPEILTSGPTVFCSGEDVTLTVDGQYASYLWNTNSSESSITVNATGNFSVEVVDENGCKGYSQIISVIIDPALYPVIVAEGTTELCDGEMIDLELIDVDVADKNITWSTDESGYSITVGKSGIYDVTVTGVCSEFESNEIEVRVNEIPSIPEVSDDTIKMDEVAILEAEGMNLAWYATEFAEKAIAFGPILEVEGVVNDTLFYVEGRSGSGANYKVGMESHEGTLYSDNPDRNDAVRFDVLEPFTLESVKVYTDLPGMRRIILYDQNFNIAGIREVEIPFGESVIDLDFEIPIGENYILSTDPLLNQEVTGSLGPRLRRSSTSVEYPYEIENVVSIKSSNFGQEFYYYFYDWSITSGLFCPSPRAAANVIIKDPVSVNEEAVAGLNIYPNPSNGNFRIVNLADETGEVIYEILDNSGRIISRKESLNQREVDFDLNLTSGIYFLKMKEGKKLSYQKIIIR